MEIIRDSFFFFFFVLGINRGDDDGNFVPVGLIVDLCCGFSDSLLLLQTHLLCESTYFTLYLSVHSILSLCV